MAVSCAKYRQRLDAQLANERTSRFAGENRGQLPVQVFSALLGILITNSGIVGLNKNPALK